MSRKLAEVPNINLLELADVFETPTWQMDDDFKDILRCELAKQMPACFKKKKDVYFLKLNEEFLIEETAEPYIFKHTTCHEAGKRLYALLNEIKEDPMSKLEISYVYKAVIIEHMGQTYVASFDCAS